jgi:hypothetical protein
LNGDAKKVQETTFDGRGVDAVILGLLACGRVLLQPNQAISHHDKGLDKALGQGKIKQQVYTTWANGENSCC